MRHRLRRTTPRLVFGLGLALFALPWLPTPAAAQGELVWLKIDFPPFYIAEGPRRGQGIGDEIVDLLAERLEGYEHQSRVASPDRIFKELEQGHGACSVAYIKTEERERVMLYSIPDMILPPNGITIRRDLLDRFGGGGPVSLERLLGDSSLKLGVAAGRAYGPTLDPLLERLGGSQVHARSGDDIYRSLFQMLVRKRLDYVLGYPYEANFVAQSLGEAGTIVNLPLTETAAIYTLAHVVCPRNDWGRKVIGEIDEILRRERPTERYRRIFERWLDSAQLPAYRSAYDETFLTTTRTDD